MEGIHLELGINFFPQIHINLYDPKSKNAYLNSVLTVADVELGSGRFKYPLIKNSVILESPLKKSTAVSTDTNVTWTSNWQET